METFRNGRVQNYLSFGKWLSFNVPVNEELDNTCIQIKIQFGLFAQI